MTALRLGTRQRILLACLVISVAAVAALTVFGISFRSVLRARARQHCIRVADGFAHHARDRLFRLAGEATALAAVLAEAAGDTATGDLRSVAPLADPAHPATALWAGSSALSAWTVYGPRGQRLAGRCSPEAEAALRALGIATAAVPPRERQRLEAALAGHPSTVLVPGGERIYALIYRPIRGPGGPAWVLQAAGEAVDGSCRLGDQAEAVLRPFVASADEPHLVRVGSRPRLMVHRPLVFGGRQLGTVAAAVPYDAEARCIRGATLATAAVAIGSLLILGILSYLLTDVAMVPLEQIQSFVRNHKAGAAVERPSVLPDDAVGTILGAYQEMLDQSQEFADRLMESNRALRDLLTGAVEALVNTIEAKDGYTAGHSQRVADTACAIAAELRWAPQAIEQLRLGALLHDIGKVGISQAILNKPGPLTAEEREIVNQHPTIGARILSSIPGCEEIIRIILHHHERCDGAGYPSGTQGDEIPLAARIVAIADVYDALTSRRSYRDAYSAAEAIVILRDSAGPMLDRDLLEVALRVLEQHGASDAAADGPADSAPSGPPPRAAVLSAAGPLEDPS